ncbi:MAG: hypothetical protein MUF28_05695 [Ignavibacterium sp.]|jgi:hypothetical protein|nr:hypothetical protein [Ignavibacterium sp.]
MKKFIRYSIYLSFSIFFSASICAQNIQVHEMIGKNQSEVIKKYGNPVHKDNTDPAMMCMFYKTNISTMIFVANAKGIYQAEATKTLDTEIDARKEIDKFISSSLNDGFTIDTVTTSDFHLHKTGTKVDLQMNENKLSNKYDIRVKANKTED